MRMSRSPWQMMGSVRFSPAIASAFGVLCCVLAARGSSRVIV
jgi:hypothetical protein